MKTRQRGERCNQGQAEGKERRKLFHGAVANAEYS